MTATKTPVTYHTAMVEARRRMGRLVASGTNPHLRSKYATLSDVLDVVNGPLLDAGLLMEQYPGVINGTVTVDTVITHAETGHQEVHSYGMPIQQQTAQGIGSAMTYARRYALMAIFGLAPEDDDGESASRPQPQRQPRRQPPPPPGPATLAEVPPVDGGVAEKKIKPTPPKDGWPSAAIEMLEILRAEVGPKAKMPDLLSAVNDWARNEPKWDHKNHFESAWTRHHDKFILDKHTFSDWLLSWITYVILHQDAAKPWQPEGSE